MGDALGVGAAHCVDNLTAKLKERGERETAVRDEIRQRVSFDLLHGDEVDAGILLEGVDGDDVGVLEGGDRRGLALETHPAFRTAGQLLGEHLDGDLAAELLVDRPPDDTHPAFAELVHDSVVQQLLAWFEHDVPSGAQPILRECCV